MYCTYSYVSIAGALLYFLYCTVQYNSPLRLAFLGHILCKVDYVSSSIRVYNSTPHTYICTYMCQKSPAGAEFPLRREVASLVEEK